MSTFFLWGGGNGWEGGHGAEDVGTRALLVLHGAVWPNACRALGGQPASTRAPAGGQCAGRAETWRGRQRVLWSWEPS